MVTHIVMWKFKEEVPESEREMRKDEMEKSFYALKDAVPEIKECQFIRKPLDSSTHDIALIVKVNCPMCLKKYIENEFHQATANKYVRPFVTERASLDFES